MAATVAAFAARMAIIDISKVRPLRCAFDYASGKGGTQVRSSPRGAPRDARVAGTTLRGPKSLLDSRFRGNERNFDANLLPRKRKPWMPGASQGHDGCGFVRSLHKQRHGLVRQHAAGDRDRGEGRLGGDVGARDHDLVDLGGELGNRRRENEPPQMAPED